MRPRQRREASGRSASLARCVRQDELTLSGPPSHARRWASVPAAAGRAAATDDAEAPVLQVSNLVKDFPLRSGVLRRVSGSVRAVDDVSLEHSARDDAGPGRRERLGQVDAGAGGPAPHRPHRRDDRGRRQGHHLAPRPGAPPPPGSMQMVFQDPYSSLDPKQSIADIVGEPLAIHTSMSRSSGSSGSSSSWPRSASAHTSCHANRTSSPVASASASPLRAPWP